MESDPGGLKVRRPRVVLKPNTKRGSQKSSRSPAPSNVSGLSDQAFQKMIQTRNQLKKEIFGETFEGSGITSYSTLSTPVHTKGITSYPTHSTPVHTTHHHTLNTQSGQTPHIGTLSSASSEYDEPDHQQNLSHFYGHNHTQSHDNHTQSHDNHTQSHNSWTQSHDSRTRMQGSSEDSSPLHKPVRTYMTKRWRKPKQNQVQPQNDDDDTLSGGLSPPPESAQSRFTTTDTNADQNSTISSHRKKLFSTADSFASTFSTTLTPLLTSDLRKGGRNPPEKGYFDFDAEGQLQSCFPDRQIQVFVVTWNMQEKKVSQSDELCVYVCVCEREY